MQLNPIPFNKPYMIGTEIDCIKEAKAQNMLAGDGGFTKRCHDWIEHQIGVKKALLTHSCTAALEMAALLLDIKPGDEIILPSYTFVSTANAFVLRGGVPVFVDIRPDTLGDGCCHDFSGTGYVAFILGDSLLWMLSFATIGSILGFFVWNYPRGLIFLGDGGAYLIGFLIGEISVLLVARHQEVSPWFPLLLVIYPVFETLFSIYRRKFIKGVSPGMPDALHLHTLVFRRLVRWAVGVGSTAQVKQNAATSPYLWILCSMSVFPALFFWRNTVALIVCVLGFATVYVWLYQRIVRFRSPKLLVNRERR